MIRGETMSAPNPPPTESADGPPSSDAAPPGRPQVGNRVPVEIQDLAFGGEGVGRIGEFVVFVPFTCPGDLVEARLTEVKRSFGRGVITRILRASPDRAEPRCRYFGECGGCQYQHVSYPAQLRWKQKQVADLFARVGGFSGAPVRPVLPCPAPYGYRNRILVRSQWNRPARKLDLGFIRHDCGLVCDVESCEIAEPALNTALRAWRADPPPKGGIKTTLRIPPEGWEVPEHSFFQNNFHALPALLASVRARLADSGVRHLVDAYCGVGFFSIELGDAVESFVGVELDAPAIRAARRNAANRGRTNGEYLAGDTDALLPGILDRLGAPETCVLLDPPRVGVRPRSIETLRAAAPAQILYVSCHPATLARDVALLCADGLYQLREVQPVDMFPQTQHVECVADLRRGVAEAR